MNEKISYFINFLSSSIMYFCIFSNAIAILIPKKYINWPQNHFKRLHSAKTLSFQKPKNNILTLSNIK